VGVAVIDSGIYNHPDLQGRVVYHQSFNGSSTADLYGHGTHVAGIIGGNGHSSTGSGYIKTFKGIAPNVTLVDLRVLDQNGSATDSMIISAIQQAIALKSKYNIRVMNLSLGRPVYESYTQDPLCQAVEAAWKAGIVVVVAAGNDGRDNSLGTNGYGTITAPGNDPYVITVGAMKTNGTASRGDDTIASYSSKGPTLIDHIVKPDLVAPGNRVVSDLALGAGLFKAWPKNAVPFSYYTQFNIGLPTPVYFTMSGTSMATPVVSGAAALLLQQNPNLTPDQVKARLMKTAYKTFPASSTVVDPVTGATYTDQYDIFTVGAGYLDIAAALANTDVASGLALSPSIAPVAGGGNQYSLVYGNAVLWGTTAPFASAVIWGNTLLPGVASSAATQANAVIWGSNSIPALAVIWGNAVVWGTSDNNTAEDGGILITGE
jgi:serine protease AprX